MPAEPGLLVRLLGKVLNALLALDNRGGARAPFARLADRSFRTSNQRAIRARCMVVRVADDMAVCRVLGRYKMYVEPSDHAHAVHLMFDGYWEIHVTEVIASLLRPGMVAVDVGANQGYFTMLMATLVGEHGAVHAVEPNGRMVDLLRRSILANGFDRRVTLHHRALGSSTARNVVLRIPEGAPSGAYLEDAAEGHEGLVTTSLDALLPGGRVDLVKIDAEGFEMPIWDGMRAILARGAPPAIIMEFFGDNAPEAATFLEEARGHGFTLACITPRAGLRPVGIPEILAAPGHQEWLLLLQRGQAGVSAARASPTALPRGPG